MVVLPSLVQKIISTLQSRSYRVFLVGGCVRDLLLGAQPKDFDLATDATPGQILACFPNANRVGAHFGVILVNEDLQQVEIATFRSDHSYEDGRRPEAVSFETDPRQDVLRRDFTINALLMDPGTCEVIDYVGGRADLESGIVRAIGDPERRFTEDHLRMLRAIRFAARLNFVIEPKTMAAMQRLHASILRIAPERIRDELGRILTDGNARRGFELLDESGLLADLLPEVAAMKGVEQPPQYHPEGDVWIHTLLLLEGLRLPTLTQAWGALLHDVGKPPTFRVAPDRIRFDGHAEVGAEMAAGILHRLRFSIEDTARITALVANHMRFKDVLNMRQSTLKRFLRMDHFAEHLELHRLDCGASHGHMENYEFVRRKLGELPLEVLKPPRLLTGNDLLTAGYKAGPRFHQILHAVEDAQLEGVLQTPEQAAVFVREHFPI